MDLHEERKTRLLKLLSRNPEMTEEELADQLKTSVRIISKLMRKLTKDGRLPDRKTRLLQLISHHPTITKEKMALKMRVSLSTINNLVRELKKEGRLTREGDNQTGYWLTENGEALPDPRETRKRRLLQLIAHNPRITGKQMAILTRSLSSSPEELMTTTVEEMVPPKGKGKGVSIKTIDQLIRELKEEGRLTRIGNNRTGWWFVRDRPLSRVGEKRTR